MPKSPNQKLKLLYLQKILREKTDENHPMSVNEMIEELSRYDISAERKSIYDDLEALRSFGLDVVQVKSRSTGYYIGRRDFELPELKLLVDSVQSSKFITHKKTLSLIKKIEQLTSTYDALELQRQVFVRNRVKSMNESVYYNVDAISGAIAQDMEIHFKYFEYTVSKERRYRRNGEEYAVSPYALMWDDENYYMLAYDDAVGLMKHYRVDKMSGISPAETRRKGHEIFEAFDMSSYSKKVFGMFTGKEQQVKLRFRNHLVGAVIDRFGKDTFIAADGEEHFIAVIDVVVSPPFYAWLFSFGDEAELLSPTALREEAAAQLEKIYAKYKTRTEA